MLTLNLQLINFFAALMLLISFGMLMQRRLLNLIHLLAWQGLLLAAVMALTAYKTQQLDLYFAVALTLILKVWLIPWLLHRLLIKLNLYHNIEQLINLPTMLLLGIALVILAFNLSMPLIQNTSTFNGTILPIALASVFISALMMVLKRQAISQVIGFLSLENSLFFAANSITSGMPMIVELGIAFDILIGVFIFGIFFFQIRETFDNLDLKNLERLKDE